MGGVGRMAGGVVGVPGMLNAAGRSSTPMPSSIAASQRARGTLLAACATGAEIKRVCEEEARFGTDPLAKLARYFNPPQERDGRDDHPQADHRLGRPARKRRRFGGALEPKRRRKGVEKERLR